MKRWIIAIIAVIGILAGCEHTVEEVDITYSISGPIAKTLFIHYTDKTGEDTVLAMENIPWSKTITTSRHGKYTLNAAGSIGLPGERIMKIECSDGGCVSKAVNLANGTSEIVFVF